MTDTLDLLTEMNLIESAYDAMMGRAANQGGKPPASASVAGDQSHILLVTVEKILRLLDDGTIRVAVKQSDGNYLVQQWIKKAILLSFRLNQMTPITHAPGGGHWWDKVPHKFSHWAEQEFTAAGFRAVPGSHVRHGAYIAPGVVLMPSFVNIGAYVGEGTMVDTWATIGSCAQIGKNCHISGGTGIGGVLEPLQAGPVIIEDNVFIGARSEVAEGVIVEQGAVISMGVFLGASTKILDRETGKITYGRVPAGAVVVPGALPASKNLPDGSPGSVFGLCRHR